MDNRLGRITPDGVQRPERTLSGQAYIDMHTVRGLSGGYFVVLDDFPAPSFDVEGEIAKLEAGLTPKAIPAPRQKDE